MNQHEITTAHPLLDKNGHPAETGYARKLLLDYDRSAIKAGKMRIKEWDYYLVICEDFAVALTIADNSYMGLDSISFIDFKAPREKTVSPMTFLPMGKKHLPSSSSFGDVKTSGMRHKIEFINKGDHRILSFRMEKFDLDKSIEGEIYLECPETESMVIVTPFKEDPRAFYYNQKINCMPASGHVKYGDVTYDFEKGRSFATLDWGRGVWTYKNTWYWGSASGLVDGASFGWNIGYGFGDTSAATENMLFYNNKAHKLGNVFFNIPMKNKKYITRGSCCGPSGVEACTADLVEDYMSPWIFTSDDGRFEMDFVPIIDRASLTDIKLISSDQHQVFGKYTGRALLDDGTEIQVRDFLGFAEKVYNKW